jgi:hypothetical protein
MSKVTDRLESQNIINLARQNYENQQRNKVPGYVVTLPSQGKIYPESSPLRAGTVEMRYMTAYDEDILSNSSYIKTGIVLEKLIDGLLLTDGVSCNEIGNPDFEALLISARIHSYGKTYPVTVIHPDTGIQYNRDIDLSKISYKEFNLNSDSNGEFEYITTKSHDTIKFKYLTIAESNKITEEHAISDLMKHTIREVNGNRNITDIEDYIKYSFLAADSREFRKYMIDNLYGLNFNMQFEGEAGSTFEAGFRIGPELLWV